MAGPATRLPHRSTGGSIITVRSIITFRLLLLLSLPVQVLGGLLRRLAAMLAAGQVAPLPALLHTLEDLPAALRALAHARHAGKVVVELLAPGPSLTRAGGWAVAGGLGALGGLAGAWLAGHGARRVALLGRTGRQSGPSGGPPLSACLHM